MNGDYRDREIERRLLAVETDTKDMGVLRSEVSNLKRGQDALKDEVSSLRRALYTAALSVAGGAIIFAATIFSVIH